MPDHPYPYYDLMRQSKDTRYLRHQMVRFAQREGIRPAARAFGTTRKTVRKWLRRYEEGGYAALAERSRAPKNPPRRIPAAQRRRALDLKRQLPSWGAARIKRDFHLSISEKAIRKIWHQARLLKKKRKKHQTKHNLREVKRAWDLFQQTCMDTKDLWDIPEYWHQMRRLGLPKVQYTAREVTSGTQTLAYAEARSLTYSKLFGDLITTHLERHGVDLSACRFQSDNGSEFVGSWNAQEDSAFTQTIEATGAIHTTIPPGAHTYEADVETVHRIIEDEFFEIETFSGERDFFAKAHTYNLYFKFARKNSYKENQTPWEILHKRNPSLPKTIPAFVSDSYCNAKTPCKRLAMSHLLGERFSQQTNPDPQASNDLEVRPLFGWEIPGRFRTGSDRQAVAAILTVVSRTTSLPRWHQRRPRRVAPGTSPGTISVQDAETTPTIHLLAYGPEGEPLERREVTPEEACEARRSLADRGLRPTLWLDVEGLPSEAALLTLAEGFGLHRLALEDVVSLGQRAKAEVYEEHLFLVVRMPQAGRFEQVSLFLGEDFVLTFQEDPGDCFEPVRERIRDGRGRIRQGGPDYLAYALIDAVIDAYFPILDEHGERLAELEEEILADVESEAGEEIHRIRSELMAVRRAIWPHRDALQTLAREAGELVSRETELYLRDAHDHVVSIVDLLEVYRELSSDLVNLHQARVSNRMNEVMKVLTVIATIFIPLTFIAGIYGMNFDSEVSPWNMPELTWRFGYPFALGVMVAVGAAMLGYFWRKGWFR